MTGLDGLENNVECRNKDDWKSSCEDMEVAVVRICGQR